MTNDAAKVTIPALPEGWTGHWGWDEQTWSVMAFDPDGFVHKGRGPTPGEAMASLADDEEAPVETPRHPQVRRLLDGDEI
jgi:hypothetical protein